MVLSSSDDGSARLWALGLSRKAPAVTLKAPGKVGGNVRAVQGITDIGPFQTVEVVRGPA